MATLPPAPPPPAYYLHGFDLGHFYVVGADPHRPGKVLFRLDPESIPGRSARPEVRIDANLHSYHPSEMLPPFIPIP